MILLGELIEQMERIKVLEQQKRLTQSQTYQAKFDKEIERLKSIQIKTGRTWGLCSPDRPTKQKEAK